MLAKLEYDFMANGWRIWLFDRRPEATIVYQAPELQVGDDLSTALIDKALLTIENRTDQAARMVPPTLSLPDDALRAIVNEANAEQRLSRGDVAQARHLDDAIDVRDRILYLIERGDVTIKSTRE